MIRAKLNGVADALGTSPDWFRSFDTSREGFRRSFLLAALTLPAYAVVARAVELERGRIVGDASRDVAWAPFLLITALFILAFPFVAFVMSTIFERLDRFHGWVVVRHWTAVFLAWFVAGVFALFLLGLVPYALPNGVLFVAMFALLGADIRLAQKVGGFGLGAAVLIASLVATLGMSLLLIGLLIYSG